MITLYLVWYERNPDFSPNYYKEHHGRIKGSTPDDCMRQLTELRRNHDLCKYTRIEIEYIY